MTNARRHHNVSKLLAIIEADVEREEEEQAYTGISLYNEKGQNEAMEGGIKIKANARCLQAQSSAIMSDIDDSSDSIESPSYRMIQNKQIPRHGMILFKGKQLRLSICCMTALVVCISFLKPASKPQFSSVSRKLPHSKGRPVIYTFYEEVEISGFGDAEILCHWEILWREAGWEPKILSIKDAKRHPDFAQYLHDLRDVPLGPKPDFDKMNFLRYLAMAAVGGGLMADVDVFPLWPLDDERDGGRFQHAMSDVLDTSLDDATADLPFNGKFSLLCGGPGSEVPCLMSGTASQWNHVAKVLLENGRRHIFSDHWSDMKALQEILHQEDVMPAHQVVAKTFDGTSVVQWLTPDDDDWTKKCASGQSMVSVHFSPHSIRSNVHQEYWQSSKQYLIRKQIAMAWMAKWGERCLDENSSYRKYLMWQKPVIDVGPLLMSSVYPEGAVSFHSASNIAFESISSSISQDKGETPAVKDHGMIGAEEQAWIVQQVALLATENGSKNPQPGASRPDSDQQYIGLRLGYQQSHPFDDSSIPLEVRDQLLNTQPASQVSIQRTNLSLSEVQEQQLLPIGKIPAVPSSKPYNASPVLNTNKIVERSQRELHGVVQGNGTANIPRKSDHTDRPTRVVQKISDISDVHSSATLKISDNQKAWLAWEAKRDKSVL